MARALVVDNDFYDTLGNAWYDGQNVAIAILRHEAAFKNAWMMKQIDAALGGGPLTMLDVGCGGGFVSNFMAAQSHDVTGLDRSGWSLLVAGSTIGPAPFAMCMATPTSSPSPAARFMSYAPWI